MKTTIKKKLLFGAITPLLLLAFVIIVIAFTIVSDSMLDEVRNSLRATAVSTLAAYEQNSGEYYEASNGDIWKGSYNISKSDALVDSIKQNTDMDVTFFYGDRRVISSAIDENGERILKSPAGEIIVKNVLQDEKEYFSKAVSINGTANYGYYIPVYQKGTTDSPIGMVFVGTNKADKDAAIYDMIISVVISVVFVMIVGMVIVLVISGNVSNAVKRSITYVQELSTGDLGVYVDDKCLQRKDEIGDLSVAIITLRDSLKNIVAQIKDNTQELTSESGNLDDMAKNTIFTLHQVEEAVSGITRQAEKQVEDVSSVSDNVDIMGNVIATTASQVDMLNSNADGMRRSSEKAGETIKELMKINIQVQKAVDVITKQTNDTDKSVQGIHKATEIITNIAEETSLLSLNASIEAARVGDAGKGFAVVASQIQKLAEQSNEASAYIEEIINQLISDSSETVKTMTEVKAVVGQQNESMAETQDIMHEVISGINESLNGIEIIADSTDSLKNARDGIAALVGSLTSSVQQNAAATQQTCASTQEVAATFETVGEAAGKLSNVADLLADTVDGFKL